MRGYSHIVKNNKIRSQVFKFESLGEKWLELTQQEAIEDCMWFFKWHEQNTLHLLR